MVIFSGNGCCLFPIGSVKSLVNHASLGECLENPPRHRWCFIPTILRVASEFPNNPVGQLQPGGAERGKGSQGLGEGGDTRGPAGSHQPNRFLDVHGSNRLTQHG